MKKILLILTIFLSVNTLFAQQDSTAALKEFVGTYKFPEGSVVPDVTVILDESGLTITSIQGSSPLVKQTDDLYIITVYNGTCLFIRDANKKIIGVHIEAMGYILDGQKTSD